MKWWKPVIAVFLLGIFGGLVTYGYNQAPRVDYTIGINGVCQAPKTLFFYPNSQPEQVSPCFRNRGGSDITVQATMTAVGATVLCNGDNSSVCSVPLTLNGGGQDYGTISFNFWPNQGSREFNLTFTLATTYSGTITEDFATLFAEVNGYAPLSVTYNLTSPYTYTLVK